MTETSKICFLQVAHLPDDDRVWFHQAKLLKENCFYVSVISTRTAHSKLENVFCFDDTEMNKSAVCKKISEILHQINPNIIICDNPLAVFFASKYRRKYNKKVKILIDITEWYPSKKNLVHLTGFKRLFKKIVLECLNLSSGFLVDGFIFGEYHKAQFFKKYFKRKSYVDLPYYPDLKYITIGKQKNSFSTWNLMYGGPLTKNKGFDNILSVMKITALDNPSVHFTLNIISDDTVNEEQKSEILEFPAHVEVKYHPYLPFEQFCKEISQYDIFLDLREKDNENNKCLPIKLFYYMACGRPSIFSDLDAIRLQVSNIDEFAHLMNPRDYHHISHIITEYIKNNETYFKHSAAALKYSGETYNWGMLSDKFLKFIQEQLV